MRTSRVGLDLIKRFESFSPVPYRDVAGVLTIGYGHTGPVTGRARITEDEALEVLASDVAVAERDVERVILTPLNQYQFDALVSFAFNLGGAALAGSTLAHLVNLGEFERAAGEFQRWRMSGGKVQNGLVRRRGSEEQLFLTPSP